MSGSIPCPSCGQSVPPGRLACPACGVLVASVRTEAAESIEAPIAPPDTAPAGLVPETPVGTQPAVEPQREPERVVASIVPGAYLPPSSSFPPASAPPAAGAPVGASVRPATATPAARPSVVPETRPPTPGRASILADLPFDAPDELEGWLVAVGGGLGIVGFLLPWRSSFQSGLEGYFDSWGLGVPAHLPIFILVLGVAILAVLPNRIARWVRTGVCGMVVGGILLGLVWLYLGGGAAEIGAILAAVGSVVMVVGGVLGAAPDRRSRTGIDS